MLLIEFVERIHKTGRSLNEMTINEIIALIDIMIIDSNTPKRYNALLENMKLSLMTKIDLSQLATIMGQKGGRSKSARKKKSSAANLIKARAKKKVVS